MRSGNLSKNTSKNAVKVSLVRGVYQLVSACELLWAQIPSYSLGNDEFLHSAWDLYQGFMVLLLMRRQRENKWGIKHLHLHFPAVTTQLCQVRKQI